MHVHTYVCILLEIHRNCSSQPARFVSALLRSPFTAVFCFVDTVANFPTLESPFSMDDGFRRVLNQELWKFTLHRLSTQEVILLSWTSQRVRDECTITKFVAFYGGRQWRQQLAYGPPTLHHRFFRRWFTNIVVWDTIWNQAEGSEERSIRGEQAIPNEHQQPIRQNRRRQSRWADCHAGFTTGTRHN